jgi:hypothetical protein
VPQTQTVPASIQSRKSLAKPIGNVANGCKPSECFLYMWALLLANQELCQGTPLRSHSCACCSPCSLEV